MGKMKDLAIQMAYNPNVVKLAEQDITSMQGNLASLYSGVNTLLGGGRIEDKTADVVIGEYNG